MNKSVIENRYFHYIIQLNLSSTFKTNNRLNCYQRTLSYQYPVRYYGSTEMDRYIMGLKLTEVVGVLNESRVPRSIT